MHACREQVHTFTRDKYSLQLEVTPLAERRSAAERTATGEGPVKPNPAAIADLGIRFTAKLRRRATNEMLDAIFGTSYLQVCMDAKERLRHPPRPPPPSHPPTPPTQPSRSKLQTPSLSPPLCLPPCKLMRARTRSMARLHLPTCPPAQHAQPEMVHPEVATSDQIQQLIFRASVAHASVVLGGASVVAPGGASDVPSGGGAACPLDHDSLNEGDAEAESQLGGSGDGAAHIGSQKTTFKEDDMEDKAKATGLPPASSRVIVMPPDDPEPIGVLPPEPLESGPPPPPPPAYMRAQPTLADAAADAASEPPAPADARV